MIDFREVNSRKSFRRTCGVPLSRVPGASRRNKEFNAARLEKRTRPLWGLKHLFSFCLRQNRRSAHLIERQCWRFWWVWRLTTNLFSLGVFRRRGPANSGTRRVRRLPAQQAGALKSFGVPGNAKHFWGKSGIHFPEIYPIKRGVPKKSLDFLGEKVCLSKI